MCVISACALFGPIWKVNPLYTGNHKAGTLADSEDPDEMQHYAAFHQGLHCLQP